MPSLTESLDESLLGEQFLRLVLSRPVDESRARVAKIAVRPVTLRDGIRYQWTVRQGSQEFHENLTASELRQRVTALFPADYADAHLFTANADQTFKLHRSGQVRFKQSRPTLKAEAATAHNRDKQYLIPAGIVCPFLVEIGVMLPDGQIRPSMYHKFRQINRYLEFVNDVLPSLPAEGELQVVDFGCGKSYLTFALHHLLTRIHHRNVSIVGLDLKEDVIADCRRIAEVLGCTGLRFEVGRIESYEPPTHVHLVVSLHACDTATDDALASAVRWQSEVILAVPCCQHDLCQTLPATTLPGLTEYGLFRERFSAMATDALRARLLDVNGYRTQILEFIDMEHTPKNVLLRAIRRMPAEVDPTRLTDYEQLKSMLGLADTHLERILRSVPASGAAPA